MNFKKTILLDLDGVLNTYDGKFDENYIPPIKEGAFDFVKTLSENFNTKIFTARNLELVSKWVEENGLTKYINGITNIKETNFLIIDDRCVNFRGDYSETLDVVENFSVWYKQ